MSAETSPVTSRSSDDATATSPRPRLLCITMLERRRGAMSERRRQNHRRDVTTTPDCYNLRWRSDVAVRYCSDVAKIICDVAVR